MKNAERDKFMERTTAGIHKDDLQFTLAGMPLKRFGSQGQQKSFLIALKLAQYAYLQKFKGFKPILLLDDIFDKLDELRVRKLMEMVSHEDFGQIFITDTNKERIVSVFNEITATLKLFDVESGKVVHA
ncbi:DNA replication and repair protein RecF [compost metagenome]